MSTVHGKETTGSESAKEGKAVPWPLLKGWLEQEEQKVRRRKGIDPNDAARHRLPEHGTPWNGVRSQLEALRKEDTAESHGRLTVYSLKGSREVQEVCEQAHRMFFSQNALFTPYLPSVARMEHEVLEMALELLHSPSDGAANITSGGSESLYCAVHAAREWAKVHRPQATAPEIIAPYSVHAALEKGCDLMGVRLVRVRLGTDYRGDVGAMRKAVTKNTIALVGSAPCWPYGLYDDIPALGRLASSEGLWFHVDGCLGGYLAPFAEAVGHPVPPWDFRVPGVTSISADLHKYGYAAKPCSSILWRNGDLREFHYQLIVDWPAGPYLSPGLTGSRPAGSVASAWAVMHFLGQDGYERLARRQLAVGRRLKEGIESLGVYSVWPSELAVFAFGSEELDVQHVVAGMSARGWFMMGNPEPPLVHLTLDAVPDEVVEAFLSDLAAVTEDVRAGRIGERGKLTYT